MASIQTSTPATHHRCPALSPQNFGHPRTSHDCTRPIDAISTSAARGPGTRSGVNPNSARTEGDGESHCGIESSIKVGGQHRADERKRACVDERVRSNSMRSNGKKLLKRPGRGIYRHSIRHAERSGQRCKTSAAHAVVLSVWQDVQEFGILYLSVIAGVVKANVWARTFTSASLVSIFGM
jgi:hypothetical protein